MRSHFLESSCNLQWDKGSHEQDHIRDQRGQVASSHNRPPSTFAQLLNLIEDRLSASEVAGLGQDYSRDTSAGYSRVDRHERKLDTDHDRQTYLAQPLVSRISFAQDYNHKPSDRDVLPSQRKFLQCISFSSLQRTGAIRHTIRNHAINPAQSDATEIPNRTSFVGDNMLDMCAGSNLPCQKLIQQMDLATGEHGTMTESQQCATSKDFPSCRPQTVGSYTQSPNPSIQSDSEFTCLPRQSNPSSRRASTNSLESLLPSDQERAKAKRLESLDPSVQFDQNAGDIMSRENSEEYQAKHQSRRPGPVLEKDGSARSDNFGNLYTQQEFSQSPVTFGEEIMDWVETLWLDTWFP